LKRFLSFILQIENSQKTLPKLLLQTVKRDCRSVTGSNLRNILLLTRKDTIEELVPDDAFQMNYIPVMDENKWRIAMIKELIDVKWGKTDIENLSDDDIEAIIEEICTS
jgi:aspartate/glutamate racemase